MQICAFLLSSRDGGTGIRNGLKIHGAQSLGGSNPSPGIFAVKRSKRS